MKKLRFDCVINAGEMSGDHRRVQDLMSSIGADDSYVFVHHSGLRKIGEIPRIVRILKSSRADFVYVEGTGVVGGSAAILAHILSHGRVRYLISSGDAASRFITNMAGPLLGYGVGVFERILYANAFAFIGWTPYLVGRAIRMGAKRGVTVEGFVPPSFTARPESHSAGNDVRTAYGIPDEAIVVCVSGSLKWSKRQKYTYGLELINAAKMVERSDVRFLVVGDGSGLSLLKEGARDDSRFVFTGQVQHSQMPDLMAAVDVAVISQTPDELGMLRLTTKLPEYLSAGVPVVVPAIPGALDYLCLGPRSPAWFLQAAHPASESYARSLAAWISNADLGDLQSRRESATTIARTRFDISILGQRLAAFLEAEDDR